jgi:hypothetical protein
MGLKVRWLGQAGFELTSESGPGIAIPMHDEMWAPLDYGPRATIEPVEFDRVYRRLSDRAARILSHGESFELDRRSPMAV